MEKNHLPLAELSPHSQQWSSLVLVMEKSFRRKTKAAGREFQRYIMVDAAGTKIQAISYNPDTDVVDRVLQVGNTYIIANAKVTSCSTEFRLVENPMQLTLTSYTVMELTLDSPLPASLGYPAFIPFSQVESYKGTTSNIDIVAVVIDKSPERSVTSQYGTSQVQDLVLVTEEKIPLVLSMWDTFITTEAAALVARVNDFPIVAALRVRVQGFRGTSISAKGLANIIVDPVYPAAATLISWRAAHIEYLKALVKTKPYFAHVARPAGSTTHELDSVADIINTPKDGWFTVRAHASLLEDGKAFYFMCCPNCYKPTSATGATEYTCHHCNNKQVASPRAKYTVLINDATTQLDVVAFGKLAEDLVGITAADFLQHKTQETTPDITVINLRLQTTMFELQIRKKQISNQYGIKYYYNLYDFKPCSNASDIASASPSANTGSGAAEQSTPTLATPPQHPNKRAPPVQLGSQDAAPERDTIPRKSARLSSTSMLGRGKAPMCTDQISPVNSQQPPSPAHSTSDDGSGSPSST